MIQKNEKKKKKNQLSNNFLTYFWRQLRHTSNVQCNISDSLHRKSKMILMKKSNQNNKKMVLTFIDQFYYHTHFDNAFLVKK